MLFETLKLAIQAIRRNALRSFLTLLGIVIGVAAVIAMVTIGNGTTAKVAADMAKLGSNLLFVRPGQFGPGRSSAQAKPFNSRDIAALRSQLSGTRAIAPVARGSATVVYGSENRNVTVTGTDNAYFITQDLGLKQGRQFFEGELRSGRAACLIGETVREELFGSRSPVGKNIRVNKVSCEVIGLLEEKGQSSFGTDQDDIVLMPLRTYQRRIAGNSEIGTVYVSASDESQTGKVQADIERLLRERRNITPGKEGRLRGSRHAPNRGSPDRDDDNPDDSPWCRRRCQPVGRRHRHHEHHAGIGHRTHSRDRHSPGHRRKGKSGLDAVFGRSDCAVAHRWELSE
jgi:putative ABC transport system permease protein